MESSHNLTITGNLFVDGGGVPVVSTLGTYQVNVNYTVPVEAQGIDVTAFKNWMASNNLALIVPFEGAGTVMTMGPGKLGNSLIWFCQAVP